MRRHATAALALALMMTPPARADLFGKAAREAAEAAMKKIGREAAEEGTEALTRRIAVAAARHGDDAIAAVRKVGPRALGLADDAGERAPQLLRLLGRHGEDAARVLARPQGMALFARYGDEAVEIMMKHGGAVEPLVDALGAPAVRALGAVGPRGGRRLAMMAEGGELARIGRAEELLGVIERHGDRAMDFVWRHKGVLAGGAALTAFLANPEPFLDGTHKLAATAADSVAKPAVTAAGDVAREAVGGVFWTLALVLVGGAAGLAWAVRRGVFKEPAVQAALQAGWDYARGRLASRR